MGGKLQVGPADLVAQVEQHFGDAAHADAADAREMQVLGTKKHFLMLLFRLTAATVNRNLKLQPRATSSRISAARRAAPGLANRRAASPIRSSAARSAGQLRDHGEQLLAVHLRVAAPAGPLRRAPWLRRCASGDRPPRTGNGTRMDGFPAAASSETAPAPDRHTTRSAAAKAAGISAMNGTISPSRPDSAKARRAVARTRPARSGARCAPGSPGLAEQRPAFARRPVQRARPLAAAGDQKVERAAARLGRECGRTPRARAGR